MQTEPSVEEHRTGGPGAEGRFAAAALRAADDLRAADRWRQVRTLGDGAPVTTLADGTPVVQFASNDYLGLTRHPAVVAAAAEATRRWGAGSGASRLVVGSRAAHDDLEAALAEWKHAEAALLFSSGYAANVGVLTSLARLGAASGDEIGIVSDELNHASIIDGARLARVPVSVAAHADVDATAAAIDAVRAAGRRPVVVTDTVFSMDGDVAPLVALADVVADREGLLVLDDAHAVFAGSGADALADHPVERVVVGTLSKTLGSVGGFAAGSAPIVDWLRNTARSFIYSTALPPSAAAAAHAALRVVRSPEGADLVERLRTNVDLVAPGNPSAVVPIVLGEERRALEATAGLLDRGLLVPAIRPPTVAPGTSRLRVALSAAHAPDDVRRLVAALADLGVA